MKPDKFTARLSQGSQEKRFATLDAAITWGFDQLQVSSSTHAEVTLTRGPNQSKTVVDFTGNITTPGGGRAHVHEFLPADHPRQGAYVLEWRDPSSAAVKRASADSPSWALTLSASLLSGTNTPLSVTLCGRGMSRPLVLSLPVTPVQAHDDTQERVCGVLRLLEHTWSSTSDLDMLCYSMTDFDDDEWGSVELDLASEFDLDMPFSMRKECPTVEHLVRFVIKQREQAKEISRRHAEPQN